MAAVTLVKAGEPAKTVTSPTDFVNLIYGQGYLPQAGGVAQAWQTLDADAPVPPAAPRPVTMADVQDQSSDFSLAQRAASRSALEEADEVAPVGAWDFAQAPTVGGVPIGTDGSVTISDATTTTKGIVELATASETTAGTDSARAVTPSGLKAVIDGLPTGGDSVVDPGTADGQIPVYDLETGRYKPEAVSLGTAADIPFSPAGGISTLNVQAALEELDGKKIAGIAVQDENGTAITGVTRLDFQGAGVTATQGTGEVVVTIPGGGGGSAFHPAAVSGLKSWTADPAIMVNAQNQALVAGQMRLDRIAMAAAGSFTEVVLIVGSVGSGLTAGQCFVGIYRADGSLVTSAPAEVALASAGAQRVTLGAAVSHAAGELLFIGILANGTTMPQLGRCPVGSAALTSLGLSGLHLRAATTGTTLTAPPGTLGALASTNSIIWAGVN